MLRPLPPDQRSPIRHWRTDDGLIVAASRDAPPAGLHVSVSYGRDGRNPSDADIHAVRRTFFGQGIETSVRRPSSDGTSRVYHIVEVTPELDRATSDLMDEIGRELRHTPEGRAMDKEFREGRIDLAELQRRTESLLHSPTGQSVIRRVTADRVADRPVRGSEAPMAMPSEPRSGSVGTAGGGLKLGTPVIVLVAMVVLAIVAWWVLISR